MTALKKKEPLQPLTRLTTLNKLKIYLKMRNIKVPTNLTPYKHGIKILFGFNNTTLEFTVTNKSRAYSDAVQYIEEMNDEFNTHPYKEYTLNIT